MPRHADAPARLTFPRQMRLARQRDFDRVFKGKCSAADERLVLYAAGNELARPRVGIVVSAKLGGAVRRNRLKRLLREAFRHEQHRLPAGFDYILIPRSGQPAKVEDYRQSLRRLADRAAEKWAKRNRDGK